MFKINSDLKRLFSNFKDLDSEDALRENEALEKHALLVMSTMDEAISNIDNVDYVYDVLNRVGQSHGRFSGFVAELFQVSPATLMSSFGEAFFFTCNLSYVCFQWITESRPV